MGWWGPRVHPQHPRTGPALSLSPKAVVVPRGAGTSQCHPKAHWHQLPWEIRAKPCDLPSQNLSDVPPAPEVALETTSACSPLGNSASLPELSSLWLFLRTSCHAVASHSTRIVVLLLLTGLQTGRTAILLRLGHHLLFRQCANISKYWEQPSKCQMQVEGDPHQGQGCNVYLCKLPKFKYTSWSTSLCLGSLQSIEQLKIGEDQKLLRATSLTLGFCFVLCEVWPDHCPSLGHLVCLGTPMKAGFSGRICPEWRCLAWHESLKRKMVSEVTASLLTTHSAAWTGFLLLETRKHV